MNQPMSKKVFKKNYKDNDDFFNDGKRDRKSVKRDRDRKKYRNFDNVIRSKDIDRLTEFDDD